MIWFGFESPICLSAANDFATNLHILIKCGDIYLFSLI